MRDWASTLRAASFRGVRFYVESEQFSGGKRIALHEYAGGRFTYLEEMGLATSGYEVTAYLLGDASDIEAKRLATACLAAGPGRLVLPMDSGQMAYVVNFQRSRSRDQRGYVAFSMSIIPLSNAGGSVLGIADVAAAVLSNLPAAARAFGGFF